VSGGGESGFRFVPSDFRCRYQVLAIPHVHGIFAIAVGNGSRFSLSLSLSARPYILHRE
jgi:hypothetical protein